METGTNENNFLDLQGVFLRCCISWFSESLSGRGKKKKKETGFFFFFILMQLDALRAVTWVSQIFALKADRCVLVRDADPLSPLSLPLNNFWLPVHPPCFSFY